MRPVRKRDYVASCAKAGYMGLIAWACENGCTLDVRACNYAAENGNLALLKYLRESRSPWSSETCVLAAKSGCTKTFLWVLNNDCNWSFEAVSIAAELGHLDILKCAKEIGFLTRDSIHYCDRATQRAQREVLEWAEENGFEWSTRAIEGMWLSGDLDFIEWVTKRYPPASQITFNAVSYVAAKGDIKLLQYLQSHGAQLGEFAMVMAATENQFECVKWLREQGCPFGRTCEVSAIRGNFEILKWAIDNGAELNPFVCSGIATHGNLELLKWAREIGCPWDVKTCSQAALSGNFELLQWVRENGCEWDKFTAVKAAMSGNIAMFKWVIKSGCPYDNAVCEEAARKKQYHILKWAVKHGMNCTYEVGLVIAMNGDLEILKWLYSTPQGNSRSWLSGLWSSACKHDRRDIIEWLIEVGSPTSPFACSVAATQGRYFYCRSLTTCS